MFPDVDPDGPGFLERDDAGGSEAKFPPVNAKVCCCSSSSIRIHAIHNVHSGSCLSIPGGSTVGKKLLRTGDGFTDENPGEHRIAHQAGK